MKMNKLPRRILLAGAAGIAVLTLAAGCGGNGGDNGSMAGMDHSGGGMATAAPSASAGFNDADVTFAQDMIPHHQQAVQMAQMAAGRASDPQIKQLAGQIKAAQDPEIQTMTGWLGVWGKPMMPSGGHEGMAMPGMMSQADMDKLMAAKGTAFDRMFAQMMIAHHNGAIQMARTEQASGMSPETKKLAGAVVATQTAEVTKLQQILDRL